MKLSFVSALALLAGDALAQRPESISMCDYYAEQLLGNNTETTQRLLLTKLINTVVLGNFTTPNVPQNGVLVLGIASPAVYNGTKVNLLPLFTGEYNSTYTTGADEGVQKLFLDDGGPVPLLNTMPANTTSSVQYHLLTHIYQYFGTILGCSAQGGEEFPKYQGRTSMYDVHRFMHLDTYQNSFFIWQLQTAALSLSFSRADVIVFGNTLQRFFNFRCSPPTSILSTSPEPELQSVCIAENCPLDPEGGDCSLYPNNGVALVPVNVTELELNSSATATGAVAPTNTLVTGTATGEKRVDRVVVGAGLVLALLAGFGVSGVAL